MPCEAIKPFVAGCSEKYGDKMKFAYYAGGGRLAIKQKVMGVPTMAIYDNGEKVDSIVKDEVSEAAIEALIAKYV